jgi:hypothetical protein
MLLKNNSHRFYCFFLPCVVVVFMSCSLCLAQDAPQESLPLPEAPNRSHSESKGFLARWAEFYRENWGSASSSGPPPKRRGLPSPLDSLPFPNSDWSYGGSPVVGEPDTNSYPLMTAINQAKDGRRFMDGSKQR